jgi:hypothetical protein
MGQYKDIEWLGWQDKPESTDSNGNHTLEFRVKKMKVNVWMFR